MQVGTGAHQVVVSGLALLDGGIDVEGEVHLTLILVGQQEKPGKNTRMRTGTSCNLLYTKKTSSKFSV